jgi:hypothetical protein
MAVRLLSEFYEINRKYHSAEYNYVIFEVFTEVAVKNVFWDIRTQFVPHRRHITSSLESLDG